MARQPHRTFTDNPSVELFIQKDTSDNDNGGTQNRYDMNYRIMISFWQWIGVMIQLVQRLIFSKAGATTIVT